jgi:hypothetical protein
MRRSRRASLILVLALALSSSLGVTQVAAATAGGGYDSTYAGESVFTTVQPGSVGQLSAIFFNSGTQPWAPGVVGLLVCLPDKVTCGVPSPNAAYASDWYSASVYASVTTPVLPGQNGFFVYNISVPVGTVPGTTVTFNGDVGLTSSAALLHPAGYYQQNTTPVPTGPYASATFDPTLIAADGVSSAALDVTLVYPGGQPPPIPPTVTATRTPASAFYCRITAVPGGQNTTVAADGSSATGDGQHTQFTVTSTSFPGECDIAVTTTGVVGSTVRLMTHIVGPPTKLGVASGGGSTRPAATTGACSVAGVRANTNDNPSCIAVLVDVQDQNGNRVTADSSRVITASLDPATCSGAPAGSVLVSGTDVSSSTASSATVVRGRATFVLSSPSPYPGCRIAFSTPSLAPAATTEVWTGF